MSICLANPRLLISKLYKIHNNIKNWLFSIFKIDTNINKQYNADLTKNPLRKIEKAVGDSTCTFSNQKWNGTKGIFIPKPKKKLKNNILLSITENFCLLKKKKSNVLYIL